MLTFGVCRFARDRVTLLTSGDLRRDEAARVREHLAACPACRRELRGWMDARAALRAAVGPEEPPAGRARPTDAFFDELQEQILAAVARPAGGPWRRRLLAAAAAVVMFGVGLSVAGLALQDRGRPGLLDLDPITAPSPSLTAPTSWVRPVGLRSWTGLRGRATADAMLLSVPDVLPQTVPVPLRSERRAGDGDSRPDVRGRAR